MDSQISFFLPKSNVSAFSKITKDAENCLLHEMTFKLFISIRIFKCRVN